MDFEGYDLSGMDIMDARERPDGKTEILYGTNGQMPLFGGWDNFPTHGHIVYGQDGDLDYWRDPYGNTIYDDNRDG